MKKKLISHPGLLAAGVLLFGLGVDRATAAQGPMPPICNRACWGARAPTCGISQMASLSRAIIHHTAASGHYNTTGQAATAANIRADQNYHIGLGWCDIAYHFLVDKHGNAFEGRNGSIPSIPRGTHDAVNNNSFGFNLMGYYHPPYNNFPTDVSRQRLYDVIAWRMPSAWSPYGAGSYGGRTVGFLDGHRQASSTACPGDGFFNPFITANTGGGEARNEVNRKKSPCNINLTQGAIRAKYDSLGGCGSILGAPITGETTCPDGVGKFNHFANNGSIYWTQATGAWELHGSIRDKWSALGWETSYLGYPTSDELATPAGGGRFNSFQRGGIYWTAGTGAHNVQGDIYNKWAALGWETSYLGFPTTDESPTAGNVGRYNHFQGGSIYWSPATGAHNVQGAIKDKWASMGYENSPLGYPTSDEYDWNGGKRSDFQGGFIYWTQAAGAWSSTELPPRVASQKKNDFNGDGKADVITFKRGSNSTAGNADGDVHVALSGGTSFGAGQKWNDYLVVGNQVPDTGDFNGDGKTDVVAFNRGGNNPATGNGDGDVLVSISSGSAFGAATKWNEFFSVLKEVPLVGDFNGDGLDDIVSFVRGGANAGAGIVDGDVYVSLSTGTAFGGGSKWHEFFCIGNELPGVGDVNGDGKDDLVLFVRGGANSAVGVGDGDVLVALSTGTGFGVAQKWNEFFCIGGELPAIGDMNGDGKADIVCFVRGALNNGANVPDGDVYVGLSTGGGFLGGAKWSEYFSVGAELPGVADFTGDGKADAITFARGGTNPAAGVVDGNVYVAPSTGSGLLNGPLWHEYFSVGIEIPLPTSF